MNNPINMAIGVAMLCCSSSCMYSMLSGGFPNLPFGGGGGAFWKGLTDPVGSTADLVDFASGGKPGNTMQQVDTSTECKIKCGGPAGCETLRRDHAAGTIPAAHVDRAAWCSGIPSATVPTTSKEKFGTACCAV